MFKTTIAAAAAPLLSLHCCPCRPLRQRRKLMLVGLVIITPIPLQTSTLSYEGEVGTASYYVQAVPAVVAVDGVDTETEFSGKAGVGIPVSEVLGVYGEVSFLTAEDDDDFGVGGKLGVKYNF